jgi:hypothetical protein
MRWQEMSRTLSGRPLSGPPSLLAEAGPTPAGNAGARQCRPAQPARDGATSAWRGDWGVRAALHLSVTLQRLVADSSLSRIPT